MKKKMWGALALSAALATGTAMPAFALDAAVGTTPDTDGKGSLTEDNSVSTDVKVLAEVTQINATLPMDVTVVANVQGGTLLVTPTGLSASEGGYRIENRTELPLELMNVKASAGTDTRWTYVDTAISGASDIQNAGGADKLGRINLTLLQNSDSVSDATASGSHVSSTAATALGWTVPAATKGAGDTTINGKLGLKIGGTTSYLNTKEDIATADKSAVKLTYTIAVKTDAVATTPEPEPDAGEDGGETA